MLPRVRPRHTSDDALLLARICEGDHAAFSELVRRHAQRFYRLAYRFMSQRAAAEDIVQDAFLMVWEKPFLWKAERNTAFTTWFSRIVVNRCIDAQRRKTHLPMSEAVLRIASGEAGADVTLSDKQRQQLLEMEIDRLPVRQRTALNLCFYEELSNKDAAAIMQMPVKALQSLVMRAKATLKERLKEVGE